MKKLTYIDLFAGCGGLSLGLHYADWKGLFAVEKDKYAFETLKHNLIDNKKHFNWPRWLPIKNHDINKFTKNYREELQGLKGKVDLVAGGPPCQGFSTAGKRNEKDKRNKLVDSYIEFISIVKPKVLFFENVKGFTFKFKSQDSKGIAYSKYVWEKLQALGYDVHGEILDFSEFGIPQRRKRFILVGVLKGDANKFFEAVIANKTAFLKSKGLLKDTSLEDAISDLLQENGVADSPDTVNFKAGKYSKPKSAYQKFLRKDYEYDGKIADSHRFANHYPGTTELFQNILKNAERNKRVEGDERKKYNLKKRAITPLDSKSTCPTLTTHPDDYIHYSEPRILTVREYARVQSFPDWYQFKGKYTTGGKLRVLEVPRYTQLGNAIPPLFGEQAGLALKEITQQ